MESVYLDTGDREAFDAFLPAHHKEWGHGIAIDAYRSCLSERLEHQWAKRRVRNLVLRAEDGSFLSSLRLYGARALHRGKEIWLGGIAEVLTPEELRGRGHAGRLLHLTLGLLAREGVDGAYLFSDIDPAFYAHHGFRTVGSRRVDTPLDRLPHSRAGEIGVRPRRPADWDAIRRIHLAAGAGEPLWFLREEDQWGYLLGRWPLWARYDPRYRIVELDCVAEQRGRIAGYAIALAEIEEQTLVLLEFGMESPDEALFISLLADLKRRASDLGCRRFAAPWPPGEWGALFRDRFEEIARSDGILMLASLSPRFDLDDATGRESGYWETDHV